MSAHSDPTPAPRPEALPAGRELDALVGEKVMGWKQSVFSNFPWQLVPPDGDDSVVRLVPHYSTDIAAAWQVQLAMCERPSSVRRRYLAEIQLQATAGKVLGVNAYVAWPDVLVTLRHRFPEAICRAALAAVERAS